MGVKFKSFYHCISIHALREEGDGITFQQFTGGAISIHALREEGDDLCPVDAPLPADFYPRPPRGGRPGTDQRHQRQHCISIHALREEGD